MKVQPNLAGVAPHPRRRPGSAAGAAGRNTPWPHHDLSLLQGLMERTLAGQFHEAVLPFASAQESVMASVLHDLQERYLPIHGLRGTLHVESDLPEFGLPESPFRSILEHLVEGALRDNHAREAFCHVGVAEASQTHVTFFLRDNGPTLPEISIEELRRFVKDERHVEVPGRIYRLFLADNLVQWLGGKVWIGASPNGAGTTVFVRLPRHAPEDA